MGTSIFNTQSRFTKTPLVMYNGVQTVGTWVQPSWLTSPLPADKQKTFVVTNQYVGRPDLISQQVYNTPFLDWVLIAFNDATNPFNWPAAGDVIQYPIESVVMPTLF